VVTPIIGNPASGNTTFKIGLTGPLTGGAAVYGLGVKNGAELAVEEINAHNGLNGKKFSVTTMDDALDNAKAATNYQKLYEDGMQVSLGGVTSGCCLEYIKNAAEDNVFVLAPSATNDDVVKTKNVYQMCFSDSGQGTVAAEYIKEHYSDRTVGVLYDSSDDYSTGLFNNFKAEFGENFVRQSFTSDNKTTFTAQINAMKSANVNFVFLPIYYTEAALFIQQAADANAFSADSIFYGCDGLDGIDSINGFNVYDYPQEISYLSHFNANSTDQKTVTFVQSFTAKYGTSTLNQFAASAYDCVYAIFSAMSKYEQAGNEIAVNISASGLTEILNGQFTSTSFSFTGVTGSDITWNSDRTVNKEATKYVVNG